MNTTINTFFTKEDNKSILRRFSTKLESIKPQSEFQENFLASLQGFINTLIEYSEKFDEHCTTNIELIGQLFIQEIIEFNGRSNNTNQELLTPIFTKAYRFLCELDFLQPGELSIELNQIRKFVEDNLETFTGKDRQQIIFAHYAMPAKITKKILNNPALKEFKSFAETAKAATEMNEAWKKEIEEKNKEIQALREGVDQIKTNYNFVGLVKGFENLATMKRREQKNSFASLIALGIIMILPIATQIYFISQHIDTIDTYQKTLNYTLPSLAGLELLLIYIFRIVLLNFRECTAHLLQINLRISLCQFIQSYSEYSTKIKKQDPSALEKFESLIFSGITSNSESLPSTFDGLEQISKLIKNLKTSK